MVTIYKIYGAAGHRQASSFGESQQWVTRDGIICILINADLSNTNEYSTLVLAKHSATEEELENEMLAQLSDGIWENFRVGKVERIS